MRFADLADDEDAALAGPHRHKAKWLEEIKEKASEKVDSLLGTRDAAAGALETAKVNRNALIQNLLEAEETRRGLARAAAKRERQAAREREVFDGRL